MEKQVIDYIKDKINKIIRYENKIKVDINKELGLTLG